MRQPAWLQWGYGLKTERALHRWVQQDNRFFSWAATGPGNPTWETKAATEEMGTPMDAHKRYRKQQQKCGLAALSIMG
jgi:hypothetical protein